MLTLYVNRKRLCTRLGKPLPEAERPRFEFAVRQPVQFLFDEELSPDADYLLVGDADFDPETEPALRCSGTRTDPHTLCFDLDTGSEAFQHLCRNPERSLILEVVEVGPGGERVLLQDVLGGAPRVEAQSELPAPPYYTREEVDSRLRELPLQTPVRNAAELQALAAPVDGTLALVEEAGAFYRYAAESTATPEGDTVLLPDSGRGRWLKQTVGNVYAAGAGLQLEESRFSLRLQGEGLVVSGEGALQLGVVDPDQVRGLAAALAAKLDQPAEPGSSGQILIHTGSGVKWSEPPVPREAYLRIRIPSREDGAAWLLAVEFFREDGSTFTWSGADGGAELWRDESRTPAPATFGPADYGAMLVLPVHTLKSYQPGAWNYRVHCRVDGGEELPGEGGTLLHEATVTFFREGLDGADGTIVVDAMEIPFVTTSETGNSVVFSEEQLGVSGRCEYDLIDEEGYNVSADSRLSRRWTSSGYELGWSGGWPAGSWILKPRGGKGATGDVVICCPPASVTESDGTERYCRLDATTPTIELFDRVRNISKVRMVLKSANPEITGNIVLVPAVDGTEKTAVTLAVGTTAQEAEISFSEPVSGLLSFRRDYEDDADTLQDTEPVTAKVLYWELVR